MPHDQGANLALILRDTLNPPLTNRLRKPTFLPQNIMEAIIAVEVPDRLSQEAITPHYCRRKT